jgi:hypothetical protein
VSSKEGTFSKEARAQIPRKIFCFWAEYFSVVGGRTVRIRTVRTILYSPYSQYGFGTEIEAVLGTIFEADFRFLFVVSGPYGTVRTTDCWHKNRGTEEVVQQYGFGTKTRQNLVGLFWCCEVFSLAGNVYLLLFCTFLKLNNNISLSLVGFPHIGVFPGICLNF